MSSRRALALRIAPEGAVPLVERPDDELMELAAAGSREAYAALVMRHQQQVRAYCARQCGGATAGDDVAQECFVELWQRRALYEPRGRFKSYLFRIAANRCKNVRRARGRELLVPDEIELVTGHGSEPDALLAEQRRRRVAREVDRLPAPQREAVLLRYNAELDYQEIAGIVGKSEATVRSRVFLGLAKLRRLLRLERLP